MSVHGACDPVKLPPVKPEAHFGFKLPRDRYRALALDTPLHTIPSASVDPDTHVYVIRFPIPFHNLATLLLRQLVKHRFKLFAYRFL
jgi:hypothetical protein